MHHAHLSSEAILYQHQALAPSTSKAYHSGIQCFVKFCVLSNVRQDRGLPPPSESFMENFVSYCASALNLGYHTIKLYLCGIRHHFILLGYGNIFNPMERLQVTLRGIKKSHSKPVKPRIPITSEIMSKLHGVLARGFINHFTDIMMWAALCAGFFGALRCGEFTVSSVFDPDVNLRLGDVSLHNGSDVGPQCVTLHLQSSKTDPFRKGTDIMLFATGRVLCPLVAFQAYLHLRAGDSPSSPLFITQLGAPLSRNQFIQWLRAIMDRAGLPSSSASGHSLRRGFATSASEKNVPDHIIKVMGRWKSDCYTRYVETHKSTLAAAHLSLAAATPGN